MLEGVQIWEEAGGIFVHSWPQTDGLVLSWHLVILWCLAWIFPSISWQSGNERMILPPRTTILVALIFQMLQNGMGTLLLEVGVSLANLSANMKLSIGMSHLPSDVAWSFLAVSQLLLNSPPLHQQSSLLPSGEFDLTQGLLLWRLWRGCWLWSDLCLVSGRLWIYISSFRDEIAGLELAVTEGVSCWTLVPKACDLCHCEMSSL